MIDLEIIRKCAEKMGGKVELDRPRGSKLEGWIRLDRKIFNPLTDDAQAMALVKKFELRLQEPEAEPSLDRRWRVTVWEPTKFVAQHTDLNRAICECVAGMP
jgi:hypothetical protein